MRFLVSPNTDEYMDRNSLWGLVRALRAAGHETYFPARALDGFETGPLCRELGVDVLFQLNRGRPYDLPKNVRHVAWFQDQPAIPLDISDRVQSSDLIYRLIPRKEYEPDAKGRCFEGYLALAVDEAMIDSYVPPERKTVDFSFCGTMVPPFAYPASPEKTRLRLGWRGMVLDFYLRYLTTSFATKPMGARIAKMVRVASNERLPKPEMAARIRLSLVLTNEMMRALVNTAELLNEPFIGNWNPDLLVRKMQEIVSPRLPPLNSQMTTALRSLYESLAIEVPRQMERFVLIENILHITDSVELYGAHWDTHPMFAPYHKGTVTGPQALFQAYGRSRVNGANTLRSILHRRILECMGIGEFLFINASINDRDPGGLQTYFEPGTHYGEYTPNNVQEEALRWIKDDGRRKEVGRRAATAVREKHLWRHRAEQILVDLRAN
jgi:Glycosyl transferases group 1